MFFAENSYPTEFGKNIDKIIKLLQKEQPEINILIINWLENLLGDGNNIIIEKIEQIHEVKTMFSAKL